PAETDAALRERVEALVVIATGRVVSVADLRAADGSLVDAGVNSIAFINLLEALERLYQVELDTERDPEALATVDGVVRLIHASGSAPGTGNGGEGART
ncbi:phosphopantetheine-binding protein, partial [Spirillospora sp. NPDC049652]